VSFPNPSFNDKKIVVKMIGGEEKLRFLFLGKKKAKIRGFIKIKKFQRVQIFNAIKVMPCHMELEFTHLCSHVLIQDGSMHQGVSLRTHYSLPISEKRM